MFPAKNFPIYCRRYFVVVVKILVSSFYTRTHTKAAQQFSTPLHRSSGTNTEHAGGIFVVVGQLFAFDVGKLLQGKVSAISPVYSISHDEDGY